MLTNSRMEVTMYVDPPQKLVDLSLYASLMRAGAKILGGTQGVELYDYFFINLLRQNNWPFENEKDPAFGSLREFILERISLHDPNDPRYTVNTLLASWLQEEASAETREFLTNPENLLVLEETLNKTLQQITETYGDPLNTAKLAKSYLQQSFDAIKNGAVEAKTGRLNETIEFVNAGLQKCENDMVVNEFWWRMEDQLKKKDWPFSHDPSGTLLEALRLLTKAGSYTTTNMSDELAWSANFILGCSKDLREAAEAVFQEFESESKTSRGINLIRSAVIKKISPN